MKKIDIGNEEHCLSLWSIVTGGYSAKAKSLINKVGIKNATKALLDNKLNRLSKNWYTKLESIKPIVALKKFYSEGGILISPSHKLWPEGLKKLKITDQKNFEPICLWVISKNPELIAGDYTKFISIVGSRNVSMYGLEVCKKWTERFVQNGYTIVSGGAYGIDIMAHKTALLQDGKTISVMASGANSYFPTGNYEVLKKVSEKGAVISECPPDQPAYRENFLKRNRIIAALSYATLVIEASFKSGAINTASNACNYSRTVGAVPGNVTVPNSAGCHRIINENIAHLITSPKDFIELIKPISAIDENLSDLQESIVGVLKAVKEKSFDEIIADTNIDAYKLKSELTFLEQNNKVRRKNNGWIRVK